MSLKKLLLVLLLSLLPSLAPAQNVAPGNTFMGALNPGLAPAPSIGSESAWFLDANTFNVWGPKTAGQWGSAPTFGPAPAYQIKIIGDIPDGITDNSIALNTAIATANSK